MKGLILVGGFGTRLRPLTLSYPTPLVDFCNKPLVRHQIEALASVGVDEVILAINYQPTAMLAALATMSREIGIRIACSHETEPLGTAGPLALARAHLERHPDDPFFVINSDVMADMTVLPEALAFHQSHGGEGTILIKKVEEPSEYGVVITDPEGSGRVDRFIEKPREYVGNHVNAGIYILNRDVLDRIDLRPTSMEQEIFPQMAAEGNLFALLLPGYWQDVGEPKNFLSGMCRHLQFLNSHSLLRPRPGTVGHVLVDPTAVIGEGCLIGPDVVIGAGRSAEPHDVAARRDGSLAHVDS
ncbi:hypothetical protein, variant 3 [Aphanomyces invadans]|uniref:mannose-1-phosphate guanylyltransferase n=1 Tax=Aphanomyces invadans TaxID=157072 RepID=A0A024UIK5_9STRA|nr:hypothetical protein, variant 3 [Aphanomyces invadans]XP_008865911.1 hypothetical protein, variant 2 [Aphanomyces invadans]ETW06133.1 hypothetical protein, variant 2 [Aphanomyces invadans]ETW06134.1 hypothetical protein, variant 3 [Aphanomyces invadans]|eukprot:XP_008865910.1 hypothetical protein, variant 3 [Aphanomyces invadans]